MHAYMYACACAGRVNSVSLPQFISIFFSFSIISLYWFIYFWDTISQCSLSWNGIHYVHQAGFQLIVLQPCLWLWSGGIKGMCGPVQLFLFLIIFKLTYKLLDIMPVQKEACFHAFFSSCSSPFPLLLLSPLCSLPRSLFLFYVHGSNSGPDAALQAPHPWDIFPGPER